MLVNFPDADLAPWYAVVPPDPVTKLSGHPGFMAGEPDWSAWAESGLGFVRQDRPKAMPRIVPHHLPDPVKEHLAQRERRRRGPRRIEDNPLKGRIAADVAWRVDIEGHQHDEVALWLDRKTDKDHATSASLEKVERYLTAGRLRLCREGVLPWLQWPNGKVPRQWYASLVFSEGFLGWYEAYVAPRRERLGKLRTLMTDTEDYVKTAEKPEQEEGLGQEAVRLVRAHLGQLSHPSSD
jgi:hypothetical protein